MTTHPPFRPSKALMRVALIGFCLGTTAADAITPDTEWTEDGANNRFTNSSNWTNGAPTSGDLVRFSPDEGPATQMIDFDTNATFGTLDIRNEEFTILGEPISITDIDLTLDGRPGSSLSTSSISINPLSLSSAAGVGNIYVTLNDMDINTGKMRLTEPIMHEGETIFRMSATTLHIDNPFQEVADFMTIIADFGSVLSSGNFETLRVGSIILARGSVIDHALDMPSGSLVAVGEGSGRLQKSSTIRGEVLAQAFNSRVVFGDPTGAVPGTTTVEGVISGPGGVVVDGPNHTLHLQGANTFTGGLRLEQGVATASSGSRLGGLSSFLQFSGGTLRTTGSFTIGIDSFISGVGGIDTNGNDVSVNGDFTGTVSGVFTKSGTGTLTLNNNGSAYAGSFRVESGTLVSGNGDTFGNFSTVEVETGATLRFDSAENFDGLNGRGTVDVNGQNVRLGTNDTRTNDFAGHLIGSGSILMSGSGSHRFSGDNSGYTGTIGFTADADGALVFAQVESLGRDIDVPSGNVVDFDLEAGESDHHHAFSGSGIVSKSGAGTLNLTNDSPNFDGDVIVVEGKVNINAALTLDEAAAFDGGGLGGDGTINGPVDVFGGSFISPGNSVGQLTVSSYRMRSDAVLAIELSGDGGVAGVDHDQLVVTGDARTDDATLSVSLVDGFVPSHGDEFQVLDIGGAITGTGFTEFDLPEVPGMAWDTSDILPEGVIAIEVLLPGDYNLDGTVDAADYTVWRDNVGAAAGTLASDTDGGDIGDSQYQTWVANLGRSLPAAAQAVPEPTAALLLAFAAGFGWPRLR